MTAAQVLLLPNWASWRVLIASKAACSAMVSALAVIQRGISHAKNLELNLKTESGAVSNLGQGAHHLTEDGG